MALHSLARSSIRPGAWVKGEEGIAISPSGRQVCLRLLPHPRGRGELYTKVTDGGLGLVGLFIDQHKFLKAPLSPLLSQHITPSATLSLHPTERGYGIPLPTDLWHGAYHGPQKESFQLGHVCVCSLRSHRTSSHRFPSVILNMLIFSVVQIVWCMNPNLLAVNR